MRKKIVVLALITTAVATAVGGAASGHPAADWYLGTQWETGERDVPWRFTNGVPSNNLRDRTRDGAAEWNAEGTSLSFDFESGQSDYSQFDGTECVPNRPFQKNAVHWQNLSAQGIGGYAFVKTCYKQNGHLHDFQLVLDNQEDWYKGVADPGSEQLDAWGTTTHEFGHAGGWIGHFAYGSSECDGPRADWQTMCQGVDEEGHKNRRSLEWHDRHTFDDRY